MPKERFVSAVDVGTTKICTLVGRLLPDDQVEVLGVGIAPSRGLRRGMVVNIEEAVESIQASVDQAERASGQRIGRAAVGIAGSHIESINNKGIVAISHPNRVITAEDVSRAIDSARTVSIPSNREILHIIPRGYVVDGQDGVRNPIGMSGLRLEVEAHIVTGAATAIHNLTQCFQQLGIEVDELVLEPLASGEAVLTEEEREIGVVLADIGGGTTDVAIYADGAVWHSASIPVGGYQLTRDLAIGLQAPYAVAEEIKQLYGYALPQEISIDDTVQVQTFGSASPRPVSRRRVSEILQDRLLEIFTLIQREVQRAGKERLLPAGLVLTGGSAKLAGIDELARQYLQVPVRVGSPAGAVGLVDKVGDPAFATSIGLLLWAVRYGEGGRPGRRSRPRGRGLFSRVLDWLREFLPQ